MKDFDAIEALETIWGRKRYAEFLLVSDEITRTETWREFESCIGKLADLVDELDQMVTTVQEA